MEHVSYVVIELHEVLPGPVFQLMPFRQHGVTGTRYDRRHTRERTELLQRRPLLELIFFCHFPLICGFRLLLGGCASREVVGRHAVDETSKIGHEERILDIGESRKRGNLGIYGQNVSFSPAPGDLGASARALPITSSMSTT